jgi:hypothetical protein
VRGCTTIHVPLRFGGEMHVVESGEQGRVELLLLMWRWERA